MALRVELPEGTYLVDVGFGNLTPTGPVSLQPNSVQTTPHEPVRFLPVGPELLLQVKLGETWDHLYRLCTHDPLDVDYEVANWYVATRPGSIFANNMIAARAGHDGIRYTFLNGRSSVRFRDGTVERRMLDNDEAIASELASRFDLSLPASLVSTAVDSLRRKGTLAADHQFFS
jgi:N-hydroxyarylamine O-acetyltransferase